MPPNPRDAIWITTPTEECRFPRSAVQTSIGVMVSTIDAAGNAYMYPTPFSRIIERANQPPLLVTCPMSDTLAIIDPLSDRRVELDLPASTFIEQAVINPNGESIALVVWPTDEQPTTAIAPVQLLDLADGTLRPLVDSEKFSVMQEGYGAQIIGWVDDKLYFHQQISGSAYFWVVDPTVPEARPILSVGQSGGWSFLPQQRALIWHYMSDTTQWFDLATEQNRPFAAAFALESPDGTMVGVISDTLQLYEPRTDQMSPSDPPLVAQLLTDWEYTEEDWRWRADSQEMLITQKRLDADMFEATIVRRNGTIRTAITLGNPTSDLVGVPHLTNAGDLVLIVTNETAQSLRWINTQTTPPTAHDLRLPAIADPWIARSRRIVYLPALR